jgi:ATP-dependent RNA helicase RhlE
VHRIGRTARAGAEGVAISLCDVEEAAFLRDIEKLIRMTIPVSDSGANQRWANAPAAARAFIRSPVKAKRRRSNRSGPSRKQSRHGQSKEAPRSVARPKPHSS